MRAADPSAQSRIPRQGAARTARRNTRSETSERRSVISYRKSSSINGTSSQAVYPRPILAPMQARGNRQMMCRFVAPKGQFSEIVEKSKTEAAAFDRVEVNVVYARRRLARQSRRVVVGDVVGLAIEDVENVEAHPRPIVHVVGRLRVEQRGRARFHAGVLDQGAWTEIAPEQTRSPWPQVTHGDAARCSALQRLGNVVTDRLVIGESSPRVSEIEIEEQPFVRRVVIRPFHAGPPGRTPDGVRARV